MTTAFIADALRPLAVPIEGLSADAANARRHDQRNLDAIKGSLHLFGQRKPIVVRRAGMVVIAGNGTLAAARALGWDQIAAVIVDDTEQQAAAFGIADNRTAELATWDADMLANLIDGLDGSACDPRLFGWDENDLAAISRAADQAAADSEGGTDGDGASPPQQVSFLATEEQAGVIRRAITALIEREGDASDGRALELICADFLAGS